MTSVLTSSCCQAAVWEHQVNVNDGKGDWPRQRTLVHPPACTGTLTVPPSPFAQISLHRTTQG